MVILFSFNDCCIWKELLALFTWDNIGCTSCTFVERLIMHVIVSVMLLSYWCSCAFVVGT